jgi:hypothetical protein
MAENDTSWIREGGLIIEHHNQHGEHLVRLLKIGKVSPKTFVVQGHRVHKEKLELQVGGTWGPVYRYVNPEDDAAKPLLRLREIQRARRRIAEAISQWRRIDTGDKDRDARIEKAQELAELLLDYVKVERG